MIENQLRHGLAIEIAIKNDAKMHIDALTKDLRGLRRLHRILERLMPAIETLENGEDADEPTDHIIPMQRK